VVASRPLPAIPRPEISARLLAAVAERDGALANRLLQQWVHRRGLLSLEAWILGPLLSSQGPGASAWLRLCLEDSAQEPRAALETAPIETAPIEAAPIEAAPIEAAPIETAVIETAVIEMVALDQALPGVPDSPAPAPASLAALRAWLPDRSEDLPLAG
jgi:hypothetical protein